MSVEYVRLINEALTIYMSEDTEFENEVKEWFCNVRKKSAKSGEYEAKAEAFDEIAQIYDENTGLGEQDEDSTNFETLVGEVGSVINSVESGDSDGSHQS